MRPHCKHLPSCKTRWVACLPNQYPAHGLRAHCMACSRYVCYIPLTFMVLCIRQQMYATGFATNSKCPCTTSWSSDRSSINGDAHVRQRVSCSQFTFTVQYRSAPAMGLPNKTDAHDTVLLTPGNRQVWGEVLHICPLPSSCWGFGDQQICSRLT
jgi:hypothetical protein